MKKNKKICFLVFALLISIFLSFEGFFYINSRSHIEGHQITTHQKVFDQVSEWFKKKNFKTADQVPAFWMSQAQKTEFQWFYGPTNQSSIPFYVCVELNSSGNMHIVIASKEKKFDVNPGQQLMSRFANDFRSYFPIIGLVKTEGKEPSTYGPSAP